jgi:hypothetical protein
MGAYAEYGARLIERGYAAIPIIPGTKRPGFFCAGMWIGLTNWQAKFVNRLPSIEELTGWAAGDPGIGIVTGPPSQGTVGAEIDTDDAAISAALRSVLPPTSAKKTGAKGETLFYYGPEIKESRSWDIAGKRVFDLIGPGRQTVLPPTVHPDTKEPYRWSGPDALEDVAPQELPELGPDIVEKISAVLRPFGYEPPTERAAGNGAGNGDDTPHRQLNEAALAELDAWIPALGLYRCRRTKRGYEAVPIWRPSSTGREPEKRHLNLKIVPEGIRDFGANQGYTPLDLVMAACGCDLDTAFGFLASRLGWGSAAPIDIELMPEAKPETAKPAAAAEPKLGDEYIHVPGVVGEIVDWITATARRPNNALALGAAVTIVGTLIGRRVAGPTRSATHLYVVALAPTGAGKQHVLDASMRLMKAAGAEGHIGPSKFFSQSAVYSLLINSPLALCLQDEIGVFLKSVTSHKASSHEKAVSQILRSAWGISFASLPPAQWASRTLPIICCPALSILGVSTPNEFYAALQGDSIENGFLNRFLVLNSKERALDTDSQIDPGRVPQELSDKLRGLYFWSGPESLLQIGNAEASYVPDVLPWANKQARSCYQDFVRMVDQHMDDKPDSQPYVTRCGEIAVRLATIRAAGRLGRGATVCRADIEWGAGLAWNAGQGMEERSVGFLPENERSAFTDKILALIRRRGLMKPRDIQGYIRGRLKSAEIKDIVSQLVEAGEVEWTADGYRPVS